MPQRHNYETAFILHPTEFIDQPCKIYFLKLKKNFLSKMYVWDYWYAFKWIKFKKCYGFVLIMLQILLSTHCILIQSFNTRNGGFILLLGINMIQSINQSIF